LVAAKRDGGVPAALAGQRYAFGGQKILFQDLSWALAIAGILKEVDYFIKLKYNL